MKNIRIVHGTLMYPLEVGSRALIFEEGRYLHTSTVIAIHGVTPQQIRFETMTASRSGSSRCSSLNRLQKMMA